MNLEVKGYHEVPALMFDAQKKAFVDRVVLSNFMAAAKHVMHQSMIAEDGEQFSWVVDSYIGLQRLWKQMSGELEEIKTVLDVIHDRIDE